MAHTATRIYIDTSVTPHLGITHDDMRAVLGVSGNNMGLILQQAQNSVKPFAKYKATRCGGFHPTDWWKGPSKTIYDSTGYTNGLDITAYDSLSALKTAMDGGTLGWTWERPRGNTVTPAEWQVRRDFNGYEHASTSPFGTVGWPNDTYQSGISNPIYIYVEFTRTNPGMLGLSEFVNSTDGIFRNWYFGFALYNAHGTLMGVGTSSTTLGNMNDACRLVNFTPPSNAVGTCRLYPFFSRNSITWSSREPTTTRRFVPLPNGIQNITVVDGNILANLTFTLGSSNRSITYNSTNQRITVGFPSVSAQNTGGSTKTLYKDKFYVKVRVESPSDMWTYWESNGYTTVGLSGTVNIAASSTQQIWASASITVDGRYGTTAGGTSSSLNDFLNNSSITGFRRFVMLYYYDDNTNTYVLVPNGTFEIQAQ